MCNSLLFSSGIKSRGSGFESSKWGLWVGSSGEGFTFVELVCAVTIILLMTTIAVPVVRLQAKRTREIELRQDLREMRMAIDKYKNFADALVIVTKNDASGYPPDLDSLAEGTPMRAKPDVKFKFLRRIPVDPMTGNKDWGLRALQDDLDSRSWGGENVFDVYSKSEDTALDGTKYADW